MISQPSTVPLVTSSILKTPHDDNVGDDVGKRRMHCNVGDDVNVVDDDDNGGDNDDDDDNDDGDDDHGDGTDDNDDG